MAQGSGPIIGEKGKQYGLVLKPKPAAAQPKLKSVFNVDDDDQPTSVSQQLTSKALATKATKAAAEEQKKALEMDPTIFDYDGVVDAIQERRETKELEKTAEQLRRQPRYIQQLMERAKIKKLEDELVYERQLIKERAVDDHLYGDKEKFMTEAYREKLEQLNKFKADLAKRAAEEEKNAVEKKGHMGDFFGNLLNNNENMGTGPRDFNGKDKKPAPPTTTGTSAAAAATIESSKSSGERDRDDRASREHRESHHRDRRDRRESSSRDDESSDSRRRRRQDDDSHQRKREYTPGGTEVPWKRFKNPLAEKKEKTVPKLLPRLPDEEIEAARQRYLKRKAERDMVAAAS